MMRSQGYLSTIALVAAVIAIVSLDFSIVQAFAPRPSSSRMPTTTQLKAGMEQIEFKIFPDGRVEETVRGVKGDNCQGVTESINEALGEIVASNPTEEMYEEEIVMDQTLTENVGDSGDSWEGKSSW